VDELRDGFREYMGEKMMFDADIEDIIKKVDFNNNGIIEYSEFITACTNISTMMSEKYLQEAFNLFDMDQNGQITPRELQHILGHACDDSQESNEWEQLI